MKNKNITHIFCSKSITIEISESLKKYNMQLWLTSYDSRYRCNSQMYKLLYINIYIFNIVLFYLLHSHTNYYQLYTISNLQKLLTTFI